MVRLIDRLLNFFWEPVVERRRFEEEMRKTVAFSQQLDMRLLAHSMAHTEGLHRVIRGMVN